MKFIVFMEWKPEEVGKVIEKYSEAMAKMKEHPARFPKTIFGPFTMGGEPKGFSVVEIDNPDQIPNSVFLYLPLITMKYVPINESAGVIEISAQMKK